MAKKSDGAGAGRPEFKATDVLKRKVSECAAVGMSQDDIARAIGCSTPTLVKHFDEELTTGAAIKRAEVTAMLFKSARKGNVAAQKHLEAKATVAAAAQALKDREGGGGTAPPAPAPREERLGKKEAQRRAAAQVGGKYATPDAPKLKLVADNG